jgi:hypothetical protein
VRLLDGRRAISKARSKLKLKLSAYSSERGRTLRFDSHAWVIGKGEDSRIGDFEAQRPPETRGEPPLASIRRTPVEGSLYTGYI